MKKKIWFVSPYSMPPQYEMRIKTQMYSQILQNKGYETLIFSSSVLHNLNVDLMENIKEDYIIRKYEGNSFVHIKTKKYSGNGIKRIFNMIQYSLKFKRISRKFLKPDVIIADVNCINYGPIYRFSKKNNIRFIIDVRDLWPMSIVEYYKYTDKNLIIKYLYAREKKMYKRADTIIFSMPGYEQYLKDKKWTNSIDLNKCYYINNGVDIKEFQYNINHFTYDNPIYNEDNIFKVVYTGSVREANNIKSLVDAFKFIKDEFRDIKLFIFGSGDHQHELEKYCSQNGITNVHFMGFVEKKYIPSVLKQSNLNVLIYKNAKTLKYGGSQNKLFEYLAAKNPVLVTIDMNYSIINEKVGVSIKSPEPKLIYKAITSVYNKRTSTQYNNHDFEEIIKNFDFEVLTNKLIEILEEKLND